MNEIRDLTACYRNHTNIIEEILLKLSLIGEVDEVKELMETIKMHLVEAQS